MVWRWRRSYKTSGQNFKLIRVREGVELRAKRVGGDVEDDDDEVVVVATMKTRCDDSDGGPVTTRKERRSRRRPRSGSDQETDPLGSDTKLMWNTRGEVGSSLGGKMNAGELRVRYRRSGRRDHSREG